MSGWKLKRARRKRLFRARVFRVFAPSLYLNERAEVRVSFSICRYQLNVSMLIFDLDNINNVDVLKI